MTNTAFVDLAYIFDIIHPNGRIARYAKSTAGRDVIAAVNQALAAAQSKGWLTILVKLGFAPGTLTNPRACPYSTAPMNLGRLSWTHAEPSSARTWTPT